MRFSKFLRLLALPAAIADNMAIHIMNGLGSDFRPTQLQSSISSSLPFQGSTLLLASPVSTVSATYSTTAAAAASDATAAVISLHHELINQPLGRFGQNESLGGANVDIGIPIRCVNCSTYGQVEVTAGEFDMFSEAFNDDDLAFSNGHFRVVTSGLGGHFEFSLASTSLSHVFTLLKVPTPIGFVVPGLGNGGVIFELDLSVGLEVEMLTNLTFGFEYSIFNGAFIDINIADITDSTSYGFLPDEGLEIKSLPVSVDSNSLDFAISATLTPKLQVGFNFFDNSTSATAVVFLNVPALHLEEKQLSNVDSNCRPASNGSRLQGEGTFVGDATSFITSAGLNLGVGAQAGFKLDEFSISNDTTTILASTTLAFPGTCVQNGHTATYSPGLAHSVATGRVTKAHSTSAISASPLFPTATGCATVGYPSSNQTATNVPYPITSMIFISGAATGTAAPTIRNVTATTSVTLSPHISTAGAPMTHMGGAAAGLFLVAWIFASL